MAGRTLLVTGFGPFPTMPRNPSAGAALRVAASPRWRLHGVEAQSTILTTSYAALATELDPALAESPDAVLMVGVAGRSKAVRVERRATDRRSLLFADVDGAMPHRNTGSGRLDARRAAIAPIKMLRILKRQALRARISHDAGRYLCNAAYFRALGTGLPVVFIHIPKPPSPTRRGRSPKRSRARWEERLADALAEVAKLCLRQGRAANPVPLTRRTV
jgi:pyroglutamyl-peptidase